MTFRQLDFKLDFSKYGIEENGLRIIKRKIFSSKVESFIEFENIGTEIREEKNRKFVWLCFSILFLILSISVFIKRSNGGKVGNGAEIFHLTISFLFFLVYQIRSKYQLCLRYDTYTDRIEFNGPAFYRRRLKRFIKQLLQKREIYFTNKYPIVEGLTLQEVVDCVSAGLTPSDGLALKKLTNGHIEKVIFNSHNSDKGYADAISSITTEENAITIIRETRDQLLKEGKNIFIYEFSNQRYRLCLIGEMTNIFDIMKVVGTSGPNYDISTDDIIEKYKKWDHQFGLFPIGIGEDFCDFEITNRAIDYRLLAEEVYAFSPDVVDQGTETVDRLEKEMEACGRIFLWWD